MTAVRDECRTDRCSREAPALEPGSCRTGAIIGRLRGQRGSYGDTVPRALRLRLAAARKRERTQDSLAYDYYLLAQHHWNRFTEQDLRLSLVYSDSAIARDPAYVNAWIGRANALVALASGMGSVTGREALGPLRQALDTILALDPGSGRAHAIRGIAYTWFEWDWDAADREFRQAFALEPNEASELRCARRSSRRPGDVRTRPWH